LSSAMSYFLVAHPVCAVKRFLRSPLAQDRGVPPFLSMLLPYRLCFTLEQKYRK
jgi:hypothetical protein